MSSTIITNLSTGNSGPLATDQVNVAICPYIVQEKLLTPQVRWYQRETFVFLTVEVMDCKDPEISVLEDKLYFRGVGGSEMMTYELNIALLHSINLENSRYAVRPRVVEFRLVKVENVWWERLLKDKIRQHWLRVDFQNWKDEDDLGDEKEPFEEMSWNTMMEGFKRHEKESGGPNPLDLAKQQNDAIKKSIDEFGEENFAKKLEKIKKDNEEKEARIKAQEQELRDRKKFYEANAPPHVRAQIPKLFQEDKEEPRIVELDDN